MFVYICNVYFFVSNITMKRVFLLLLLSGVVTVMPRLQVRNASAHQHYYE